MNSALTIFISFVSVHLLFMICYFSGKFILRLSGFKAQNFCFQNFFYSVMTGSFAVITLASLIMSHGITIHVFFILAAVILLFERSKNPNNSETHTEIKITRKHLLIYLFVTSFIFAWNQISSNSIEIHAMYYGEVSKCLVHTGFENTFTISNFAGSDYHFPTPYHYSDLWLNGIVSVLNKNDFAANLYLVTYPFFMSLFAFGLLALIEHYRKVEFWLASVAMLCLFVGGFIFSSLIGDFGRYSSRFLAPTERCYGSQLLPVYCFSAAAIILFLKENRSMAFICLMILPVISIVFLPAISGGLGLYFIFHLILKKNERKFWSRMIIYAILIFGGILIFYEALTKNDLNYRMDKPLLAYSDWKDWRFSSIKFFAAEIFNKSWPVPFLFFLNYLPYISVLFFLKQVPVLLKQLMKPFLLICFCGLAASLMLYKLEDSHELFINTLVILHVLLSAAFIYWLCASETRPSYKWISISPFMLGCASNLIFIYALYSHKEPEGRKFSQTYIQEIRSTLKNEEGDLLGVLIASPTDTIAKKDSIANEFTLLHQTYYNFPHVNECRIFIPFNLSSMGSPKNPFSRFLTYKSQEYPGLSADQLKELFIRLYKIRYLLTRNDNDPLVKKLKVKKIIRDDLSGQKFILLDTN